MLLTSFCREKRMYYRRTLTYFLWESIAYGGRPVWLVWICPNKTFIQQKQSSWNQANKTGGQLYCDTSPYKISECNAFILFSPKVRLHCDGSVTELGHFKRLWYKFPHQSSTNICQLFIWWGEVFRKASRKHFHVRLGHLVSKELCHVHTTG